MASGQISLLVSLALFLGFADSATTCNTSTDCLHGGTCFKSVCYCTRQYIGDLCETAFQCKTDADCLYLGKCQKYAADCQCSMGYYGANCALVYNCKTRNPCFDANLSVYGLFFEQPDPHKILVCDRRGRCLDLVWRPSAPGIIKSAWQHIQCLTASLSYANGQTAVFDRECLQAPRSWLPFLSRWRHALRPIDGQSNQAHIAIGIRKEAEMGVLED